MIPAPGSRLGPYEIVGRLGAGGMGEVYRARDTRLGREVALKVLPPELANDAARRARFEQEARAAAALNHPNIMAVYDIGSDGDIGYMVTELVSGETLAALLERGPVPIRKLLDIAVQIAEGMACAHAAHITHRDLKPANIMITGPESGQAGRVKILDFGLAKQAAPAAVADETVAMHSTEPGMILGTVNYMSPEQARGKPVDYRSDQFSFGIILYEMASGKKAVRETRDGPDHVRDSDGGAGAHRSQHSRAAALGHRTMPGQGSRRPLRFHARSIPGAAQSARPSLRGVHFAAGAAGSE